MDKDNLDKLRAVSEILWAIIDDLKGKGYDAKDCLSTWDNGYEVQVEDFDTIAADLLRLAEENERLKKAITDHANKIIKKREARQKGYHDVDEFYKE